MKGEWNGGIGGVCIAIMRGGSGGGIIAPLRARLLMSDVRRD